MTCARRRMVRGETQYNKMSRFLKEVPLELISTGNKFSGNGKSLTDHADYEEPERKTDYQIARQAFKTKAFAAVQQGKSFGKPAGGKLEYGVGDRVRHIKFGEGTVLKAVKFVSVKLPLQNSLLLHFSYIFCNFANAANIFFVPGPSKFTVTS